MGIGSLHPLTGHHGGLGEELGSRIDGLGNGVIQSLTAAEELALVAAAQLKQHCIKGAGVACHFRSCLLRHILELFPLPGGHEDGQALLFFILGYLSGDVHPLAEELYQLIVDFIDLAA